MKSIIFLLLALQAGMAGAEQICNYQSPGYLVNRFEDLGDGSVRDRLTSLIWQRCTQEQVWNTERLVCEGHPTIFVNWKEALQFVEEYNQGQAELGLTADWRLPNIKELSSLVNLHCAQPAIDTSIFPETEVQTVYWSSTPVMNATYQQHLDDGNVIDHHQVWVVDFRRGVETRAPMIPISQALRESKYLRLVRGGGQ